MGAESWETAGSGTIKNGRSAPRGRERQPVAYGWGRRMGKGLRLRDGV